MCKIGNSKQFPQQFFSILSVLFNYSCLCVFIFMWFFYPYSVSVHWNTQDLQCTPENVNSKSALFYHYQNRNKRSLAGQATTCFVEAKKKNTLPSNVTGSGINLHHQWGQIHNFASRYKCNGLNITSILVSKCSVEQNIFKIQCRAILSLKPRGRHGRKRRIRYASVLLAAPSVTGAGVAVGARGEERERLTATPQLHLDGGAARGQSGQCLLFW